MTTAVGYIRVSTGDQARDGLSLPAQQAAIERYCELKDYAIEWIYEDAGISGRRAEAIEYACQHRAVLVVHSLSRLCRSTIDFARTIIRLDAAGASLVSISEDINLVTAVGRAVAKIIVVMAELESEQTGERVRLAHAHKRATEGWRNINSRTVPFGWRLDRYNTLVRCRRESRWCARMVAWRMAGESYEQIADRLNRAGVKAKQGDHWHFATVQRIVARESARRKVTVPATVQPLRGRDDIQQHIRKLYASGRYTLAQLAARYGCHKTSVWRVVHQPQKRSV